MWQTEIHIQVDTNSETCALSLWAMLFTSLPVICDAERSHIGMVESESHSVVSDSLWPHGLYSSWNSPGQNTRVGSLSLLQGIFPTQGLNPGLWHCRWILYQLSHRGSPRILEWEPIPSPEDLPYLGNEPGSPALQVDSLQTELSTSIKWSKSS